MAAAGKVASPPYPPAGLGGESSVSRVSFLGARLPPEVEAMAKSARELNKDTFRKLLKVTVRALEGKDCRDSVKLIAESSGLSDEQLAILISGMYTLLREALRLPSSSLKQEVFKEDLKELRIPEDFIADFATAAFGNRRPTLEATLQKQGNKLPRIEDFKWRVDVAISTRSVGGLSSCQLYAAACCGLWKLGDDLLVAFETQMMDLLSSPVPILDSFGVNNPIGRLT